MTNYNTMYTKEMSVVSKMFAKERSMKPESFSTIGLELTEVLRQEAVGRPVTKICPSCKEDKPLNEYHKNSQNPYWKLEVYCKVCRKIQSRQWRIDNFFKAQDRSKRAECKQKGILYNLTPQYLEELWTGTCPIFGVSLIKGSGQTETSPSIDRIRPDLGYVKGNVQFISARANRIKYNASAGELRQIADYIDKYFNPEETYSNFNMAGELIQ